MMGRNLWSSKNGFLMWEKKHRKWFVLCKNNVCVCHFSFESGHAFSLDTTSSINLMCWRDDGPGLTAEEGEKALLCPRHIVQQAIFSTLLYDHTHKNKMQLSTLYRKVGFGQPARQESVNLIVTRHWKTITCQKTCFQDLLFQQHNGIAKVQPCMSIQWGVGEKPSDW